MNWQRFQMGILVGAAILLVGLLPVIWYGTVTSNQQSISAREAQAALLADPAGTVLVDLRSSDISVRYPLTGALQATRAEVDAWMAGAPLPEDAAGKTLYLLADSGLPVVAHGSGLEAYTVSGGWAGWVSAAANPERLPLLALPDESVRTGLPAYRDIPPSEQVATVTAAYLVKPIYMLLAAFLAVIIWRQGSVAGSQAGAAGKSRLATDLLAVFWGLVFFLIGELACWINFTLLNEESAFLEYLHSFGMVVCVAFLAFALIEGLDHRVLHYSDQQGRCTFLGLCKGCAKHQAMPCGLTRLFIGLILMLIVLSFIPLSAPLQPVGYNSGVLSFLHSFTHPIVYQVFELRISPIAALACLAIAFLLMLSNRPGAIMPAKILLACGLGFLSFSLLRLAFVGWFTDQMAWFAFWEETTELILVAFIGLVLWIFRRSLLPVG